jgi:hypothetical protein
MWYDQDSLSRDQKPGDFASNWPLFHSHSTRIRRIVYLKAGSERAPKTGHSTYSWCYNMIRTQILNWSQSCRNREVGTAVRFQPGQKPTVLCPVRVTTRQAKSGSGFWPGLEPNRTEPLIKTRTAGGLPGPVANTIYRYDFLVFERDNII